MKILIVNSRHNIKALLPLFERLTSRDNDLYFLAHDPQLIKALLEKNYPVKKIRPQVLKKNLPTILLSFFLPLLIIYGFFFVLFYKLKKKNEAIVYFSEYEKIIYTLPAKILKIKNIWFFLPETESAQLNPFLQKIIKLFSRLATIIVFNQKSKNKINKIINTKSEIHIVPLGIKNNRERQENIFEQISKADHGDSEKKYFTIGTAINLNKKQNMEMLFHAIENCTSVLPNLQLIIIGEGEEKKNLNWLAKKMNIGNITWFVGEQKFLHKWFDNFNIFVSVSKDLNLDDIEIILNAMEAKLPVIGFWDTGIDDLINVENNGKIIEKENSELLANEIINLYKHKVLCHKLGEAAKSQVDKNHNLDKMTNTLLNVINK